MKAYHFCAMDSEGQALLRDGSVVEPGAGEKFEGPVVICESGLHASKHVFDALRYAPGAMLRLVECSDVVEEQDDKFVCRSRVELARVDASRLLREFACDCAERVLPIFEVKWPDDKRPRQAIEVARRYARDEATEEELAAAWDAAWDAARAAAGAAAWDAAWAAAWDAAWAAAWDAARAAARAAETKWQRTTLARRVNRALREAAR